MSALKPSRRMSHLDVLESEAIHIMREAAGERSKLALLFSGGKDSAVVLHLATKAFWPERLPFPLLHVDTGHNFPEVLEFRDATARRLGERLIVREVEASILRGTVKLPRPDASRNGAQSVTLLEAVEEFGFDALIGGARRDEEKARAKERIFSHRDEFGAWNPKAQRAELWSLYNTRLNGDESVRVFPLSNWIELDVWRYIQREKLALPSLYFAAERPVIERDGALLMLDDDRIPLRPGETAQMRRVRFRTLGCWPLTAAVDSDAGTLEAVVREVRDASVSERQGRAIDHDPSASMERKKREGYF